MAEQSFNDSNLVQFSYPSGGDGLSSGESTGYYFQERAEGFDYEFVPTPDSKYECAICLLILREPRQTKCGHRFCRDCIMKWLRESESRCPVDNEAVDERELFADNFARREILNFKVKCPNVKQGCDAIIVLRQLQQHIDQCPLALVPCPNNCMDILLRRDIPDHVQNKCACRLLQCQNCQERTTAEAMEKHLSTCPMVRVFCQFCSEEFTRKQLDGHLETSCPKKVVSCDFEPLGCNEKMERAQKNQHNEEAIQRHMHLLCSGLVTILRCLGYNRIPAESQNQVSMGLTPMEMSGASLQTLGNILQQVNITDLNLGRNLPTTPHGRRSETDMPSSPSLEHQKITRSISDSSVKSPSHQPAHETARVSYDSKPSEEEGVEDVPCVGKIASYVSGDEFENLKVQNMSHDESLARHTQQLQDIQHKNYLLESANQHLKDKLKRLENTIQDIEGRACNGCYYWKIKNYSRWKREAEEGETTALHSPPFSSSCYGYRLCVRANLNGVDAAKGRYLSVFIHFLQGEFDDILDWPFSGRIILSVIDQNQTCELRNHIAETLIAKPHLAAFQRPMTPRNHKGFGYMEFLQLSVLDNATFLKNDCLIIKAQVIPGG